jgi:hypothetical protein
MQHLAGGRVVDFVVSKVAMSICALMVVAVLAGVFDGDTFADRDHELSGVLHRLSDLIDRAATSSSEFTTGWRIPLSSGGNPIVISLGAGSVSAESDGRTAMIRLACGLHTWTWDGRGLNLSAVYEMDRSSPQLRFESGMTIQIRTILVTFENEPTYLVFASQML